MPRFGLQSVGPIDYRSSLPQHDPNNAIWPRISAFAKMLHDISWEDDDEYDDGTGRTEEERKADFEQNARENAKTSEDRKMDGYSEYLDDQSRLTEDEKKTQAAEQQLEDERERRNIGFGGDRSGGMDRQRQLAEQTGTGFSNKVKRIAESGEGFDMEQFPELFTETEDSKRAMQQYLNKLRWEDEMQGYRPLSSFGR